MVNSGKPSLLHSIKDAVSRKTDLFHPKIYTTKTLLTQIESWRSVHKRIVFTNGCYDIIHPGHVDLLARAKNLGDILILGINSDASVHRLGKGEDRPINSLQVRAFIVAHLASVDAVISFDEDTPLQLIALIQPDILVKGGDWSIENIVGREIVEKYGGSVFSLPLLQGYSTTEMINRIRTKTP